MSNDDVVVVSGVEDAVDRRDCLVNRYDCKIPEDRDNGGSHGNTVQPGELRAVFFAHDGAHKGCDEIPRVRADFAVGTPERSDLPDYAPQCGVGADWQIIPVTLEVGLQDIDRRSCGSLPLAMRSDEV